MAVDPTTLEHNLNLTDREKKIIMVKYIIHGIAPFSNAPLKTRVKMLKSAASIYGFDYNDEEFQEIGRACLHVQQEINYKVAEFVNKDPDLYKAALDSIKRGNDEVIKVVDHVLDQGLKKMGLKK